MILSFRLFINGMSLYWGEEGNDGSWLTLDGVRYDGELEFYYYDSITKKYAYLYFFVKVGGFQL